MRYLEHTLLNFSLLISGIKCFLLVAEPAAADAAQETLQPLHREERPIAGELRRLELRALPEQRAERSPDVGFDVAEKEVERLERELPAADTFPDALEPRRRAERLVLREVHCFELRALRFAPGGGAGAARHRARRCSTGYSNHFQASRKTVPPRTLNHFLFRWRSCGSNRCLAGT